MTPETPVFCLCLSTSLNDRRSPFPEELFKVEKKHYTLFHTDMISLEMRGLLKNCVIKLCF